MLQCSSKNMTPNRLHPFPFDCTYIHFFRKRKSYLKKTLGLSWEALCILSDSFNQKSLKTGLERQFGSQKSCCEDLSSDTQGHVKSWTWWYTPIIPMLEKWTQGSPGVYQPACLGGLVCCSTMREPVSQQKVKCAWDYWCQSLASLCTPPCTCAHRCEPLSPRSD